MQHHSSPGPRRSPPARPLPPLRMRDEPGTSFCQVKPFIPLAFWAWKLPKKAAQTVYDDHFAQDNLWADHEWDLHVFWHKIANPSGPIILVPVYQADEYVANLRKRYNKSEYVLPSEPGLVIDFARFNCQPNRLRPVSSKAAYDELLHHITDRPQEYLRSFRIGTNVSELAALLDHGSKLKNSQMKKNKAAKPPVDHSQQMIKLQQYLGLDDAAGSNPIPAVFSATSPAPYTHHDPPVLISIDVEAHEGQKGVITEVGISVLDTAALRRTPPGPFATSWRKHIRGHHLRVAELAHHVNTRFVTGCPDRFQHGTSRIIPRARMPEAIARCFRPPFDTQLIDASATRHDSTETTPNRRPIVLVGHGVSSDVDWLRQIGYDVTNLATLEATIDSTRLWSAISGTNNQVSLSRLLQECDIDGWFLHNAGNDAFYTLEAVLALAVETRQGGKFALKQHAPVPGSSPPSTGAAGGPVTLADAVAGMTLSRPIDVLVPSVQQGNAINEAAQVPSTPQTAFMIGRDVKPTSSPKPAPKFDEEEDLIQFD